MAHHDRGTLTCVYIVQCVGDSVQRLEKLVIINALTLWTNTILVGNGVQRRVHALGSCHCCRALGFLREGRFRGKGGGGGGGEGRGGGRGKRGEG